MKSLNISLKSLSPAIEWIEHRTKLQRILIYLSTIVILVGAFVYFAYLPKHKQIGVLDKTYKDLSAKLEKAKINARQLNAYRTKMKTAEAQVIKEFYADVPLSIHVAGNYHNVAVFFDKISNLPRIVNVNAIKLIPQKKEETKLNATCEAVTYKFVEPSAVKKKSRTKRKK